MHYHIELGTTVPDSDPGFGTLLAPGSTIFSESLQNIFGLKILKFLVN
jgi:hypothetical protein